MLQRLHKRLTWGGVTDPDFHDPSHFRYLVHFDTGSPYAFSRVDHPVTFLDSDSPLASIRAASRLACTVLKEGHVVIPGVSGNRHGFILNVPQSDVIATHTADMLSSGYQNQRALKRRYPPRDAEQFCNELVAGQTNEVVIRPHRVAMTGIVWVSEETHPARDLPNLTPLRTVQSRALGLGLPLVEL